jgi:hypothetical protein
MNAPKESASAQADTSLLVIDLDKRQSRKKVKELRKGRGKLFKRVEGIVADLVADGTIKAGSQPVVIIVREEVPSPLPMLWPRFPT